VVERHGSALVRLASPAAARRSASSITITTAAPSLKMATRWGDWYFADALAGSLRARGHPVRLQTADHRDDLAGRAADVHLVLRGLQPVRRTPGQRHVLWIISHPELVDDDELDAADLVLVASEVFAAELAERTATPVEVFLQATDHRRFRPRPPVPSLRHHVVVVAKTRDVLRPIVADALAAGLAPTIFGSGWERFVDPTAIAATHVPNEQLPDVYSSADVLLNDHWDSMRRLGFVSNRIFDALACGTPVISDAMPAIDELFGDAVATYGSVDELAALATAAVADPDAAHQRAAVGRQIVLDAHTMDHRAEQLDALLARLGLDGP
jgi:glycosyltransferase involved in cell wall biosynthesis